MVTLTKEGDSLTFDYTGTSEQAPSYVNCAGSGGEGGVFGAVAPLLAYDMPWCQGVLNPLKIIINSITLRHLNGDTENLVDCREALFDLDQTAFSQTPHPLFFGKGS